MKLYNSLGRQIEEFVPIHDKHVGMYTCGPTVYSDLTIGNWRTYTMADVLIRTLKYLGYEVDYVMNITDVGHLTGDNLGDASQGEDRLETAAQKTGRTAWDIAKFYTDKFLNEYQQLHLTQPRVWCKATDHISEQIAAVKTILDKGFGYQISDGIYFDTRAYEAAGNTYGELSNLNRIQEGARVEPNPEKKDPRDFALWKFSPVGEKRQMEWDSPWAPPGRGKVLGFPGWHIECSAMSQKYLGDQFDIHAGGEDLKSTHHPNEIAQAEAITGKKPFVKYWVHGAFLLVDGGRMGKSLGNAYTLTEVGAKGFSAMDLRYFYFTGHYRKQLNFTWEALASARQSLTTLKEMVMKLKEDQTERMTLSEEKLAKIDEFRHRFNAALENDLNIPEALAVVWETIKSNIPSPDKYDLVIAFDDILGFGIQDWQQEEVMIPAEIMTLVKEREMARNQTDFIAADKIRDELKQRGYEVLDSQQGSIVKTLKEVKYDQ